MNLKTFYENENALIIICVCFTLWPLIIPAIIGFVLMNGYKQHLTIIKTEKINAENRCDALTQANYAILNDPIYIDFRTNDDTRKRTAYEISVNNGTIAKQQQRILELNESVEKLEKKEKSAQNKLNRIAELSRSVNYSISTYFESEPSMSGYALPKSVLSDLDELSPTVTLHLHNMDVRDLQKAFRKNDKDIENVLEQYLSRYTTKANKTIYQLMVIALRAELQNILAQLRYEKLDTAIEEVKTITSKYLSVAGEGNQNIISTLTKFIGQIEYLFINSVKIEYNYYVKKEQARQEQLAIREQMRLEAQERKELEAQKRKIEQEESKYNEEIERIKAQLLTAASEEASKLQARIVELQSQLSDVVLKKDEITKLQNGKAGNIYIISNLGAFGEDIFKIGMTRRLDPQERVNELGSASVPFKFDVHSFIFSDNAVDLESQIHERLTANRVNKVNLRKEFFKVPIDDLEALVQEIDPTAEFTKTMAAEEYRQSLSSDEVYVTIPNTIEDYDEDED